MRFLSYLIIALVATVIGYSYISTIYLIQQDNVTVYQPPIEEYFEEHYLLEPVVNLIAADLASAEN